MILISSKSEPKGTAAIPPSKSHTIRAIFLASLADGVSTVKGRLESADADSAISVCRALGAEIDESADSLTIRGTGGKIKPRGKAVDVGNSGTTARFVLSMASLSDAPVTIDGDEQTRKRPMGPLLKSLSELGATVISGNEGRLPVTIKGPIKGGITTVDGTTSQYLSSLLLHAPFCETETTLLLTSLNEKPYVDMTCGWLKKLNVKFSRNGYGEFVIPPAQNLKAFSATVPADFSSAAFFLALAAIPGSEVEITGLDMNDTQGDKKMIDMLKGMGAQIECPEGQGQIKPIKIKGATLKGATIDLNDTPDALPAMAVVGCLADGQTRLTNVPQARIKETDRIAVMANELKKMGADIEEESDGLVIRKSNLNGAKLNGHDDHRVVMSLAVAGLAASGTTEIDTAQAINVTFPNFVELMRSCGANMDLRRA
ncbi:MAG: 3-phosphoshikimate 1-carboxyvinyltransferase [Nitrospinota bacterium]